MLGRRAGTTKHNDQLATIIKDKGKYKTRSIFSGVYTGAMIKYTLAYGTAGINLVTEDGPNPHVMVRAQVVNDIADHDTWHLINGATRLNIVVSAARVPPVRPNDVDLTNDMAEAKSSTRNSGYGIRVVVDAPEVIHLRV